MCIEGGKRVLYQEGAVTAMIDPRALIAGYAAEGRLADGTLMFGGTLAAHGGVRATERVRVRAGGPGARPQDFPRLSGEEPAEPGMTQ